MIECRSVTTPMEMNGADSQNLKIKINNGNNKEFPFREAIGSLMYLMIGTRPDLAYFCWKVSSFL